MIILYYLFYSFVWVIALLPFKVLYALSYFVYLIIYYLIGYRKLIVRLNLKKSFPEKSETDLKILEKQFYLHIPYTFIETIKLLYISN